MSRSDIDDTVRDMWSTRPHRRRDDRKIAGVAAAIGRRYRIDPVLVRVAFVVTTIFGGVGILLYLLGWLLLPEDGDEVSGAEAMIGQGRSSMSKPLTIVLMIALIPAASGLFTGHVSALFSLAAVGAAVYLLHKHRAGTPVAMAAPGMAVPGLSGTPGPGMAGGYDAPPGGAAHASADPWDGINALVHPPELDLPTVHDAVARRWLHSLIPGSNAGQIDSNDIHDELMTLLN